MSRDASNREFEGAPRVRFDPALVERYLRWLEFNRRGVVPSEELRDAPERLRVALAPFVGWLAAQFKWPKSEHDDRAHTIWERVLAGLPNFEGRASASRLLSWMRTIAERAMYNRTRRRRRPVVEEPLAPDVEATLASHEEEPERTLAREEVAEQVRAAVDELCEPERPPVCDLFRLCFLEGLAPGEAADRLGIPRHRAYKLCEYARLRLRAILRRFGL